MTRKPVGGTLEPMGPDPRNLAPGDTVDERGVVITAAGRARARAELDAADAYWTPERRAQARREFRAKLDALMAR